MSHLKLAIHRSLSGSKQPPPASHGHEAGRCAAPVMDSPCLCDRDLSRHGWGTHNTVANFDRNSCDIPPGIRFIRKGSNSLSPCLFLTPCFMCLSRGCVTDEWLGFVSPAQGHLVLPFLCNMHENISDFLEKFCSI